MPLEEYKKKRDFRQTSEPADGESSEGGNIFVIQKHDASRLHYDFRLEIGDVLVSWAVPKGPSTNPAEKRLAVMTEDHPISYADFEGVIPEGQYGGGSVIVWDRGTYRSIKEKDMEEQLRDGHIEVWLEGEKLQGGYALINSKLGGKEKNWLLVKMNDEKADRRRNPVSTEPNSVLSGKTVEEI
ncbi:MAG: DNA polymerase ligase N-terminal domain-containing protein [Candidatus Paceibacterota bacterium]